MAAKKMTFVEALQRIGAAFGAAIVVVLVGWGLISLTDAGYINLHPQQVADLQTKVRQEAARAGKAKASLVGTKAKLESAQAEAKKVPELEVNLKQAKADLKKAQADLKEAKATQAKPAVAKTEEAPAAKAVEAEPPAVKTAEVKPPAAKPEVQQVSDSEAMARYKELNARCGVAATNESGERWSWVKEATNAQYKKYLDSCRKKLEAKVASTPARAPKVALAGGCPHGTVYVPQFRGCAPIINHRRHR